MLVLNIIIWLSIFSQFAGIVYLSSGVQEASFLVQSYVEQLVVDGYEKAARRRLEAGKTPRLEFDCLVDDGSRCVLMQASKTDLYRAFKPFPRSYLAHPLLKCACCLCLVEEIMLWMGGISLKAF